MSTKRHRGIAAVTLTAAIFFGTAGSAFAAIKRVGGGTWNYGSGWTSAWSYYTHGSRCHSSAVLGGDHSPQRSGPTRPGRTAVAQDSHKPWQTMSTYWNNRC
ncbi:MAG: lactococcin 972 family bacteriocin [Peptidiphaga sp.]